MKSIDLLAIGQSRQFYTELFVLYVWIERSLKVKRNVTLCYYFYNEVTNTKKKSKESKVFTEGTLTRLPTYSTYIKSWHQDSAIQVLKLFLSFVCLQCTLSMNWNVWVVACSWLYLTSYSLHIKILTNTWFWLKCRLQWWRKHVSYTWIQLYILVWV